MKYKNSEGYPDSTAGIAAKRASKKKRNGSRGLHALHLWSVNYIVLKSGSEGGTDAEHRQIDH